ncbi:hypothetical protein CR513_48617, partial [Mucuna pruriens]
MSSAQRAWIVAGSVGVVEALKDQGVCRWNHSFKSAQHLIKTHVGSFSQAKNLSTSSMVSTSNRLKGKQSEESLRTVILPLYIINNTSPFASSNILDYHVTLASLNYFLSSKRNIKEECKMSSSGRAWIVATSVGVVEALKDQGLCRWNYALRAAQKQVKSHVGSLSQTKKLSSSTMVSTSSGLKGKQSEESLRTVMYLSCWGPN